LSPHPYQLQKELGFDPTAELKLAMLKQAQQTCPAN